jgi:DNA-binding NtrC family response regulator
MAGQLSALVVMPSERRGGLIPCLTRSTVQVRTASTCHEAAEILRHDPTVRIVLTDIYLSDGTWVDILRRAGGALGSPRVVVCPRLADERLWAQLLEAGAFDILVEPYHEPEVARILDAAALPLPVLAAD